MRESILNMATAFDLLDGIYPGTAPMYLTGRPGPGRKSYRLPANQGTGDGLDRAVERRTREHAFRVAFHSRHAAPEAVASRQVRRRTALQAAKAMSTPRRAWRQYWTGAAVG